MEQIFPCFLIESLHVNELLARCSDKGTLESMTTEWCRHFKMKYSGELRTVSGVELFKKLKISMLLECQSRCMERIIYHFHLQSAMSSTKLFSILNTAHHIKRAELSLKSDCKANGCIIGITIGTYLYSAYCVRSPTKFVKMRNEIFCAAVQGVLKFIFGTKHFYLKYGRSHGELVSVQNVDAYWAEGAANRRSVSG